MNLQQLEYIIAIDEHRHFQRAADACFVTQPTLSMMVQKLEDELGIRIFDRQKHPVQPTSEGIEIIRMARKVLKETKALQSFAKDLSNDISGELHLGIIPTLAPYLLPRFLKPLMEKYPGIKLFIKEMMTHDMLEAIDQGRIDIGILATPTADHRFDEYPLFYEEFYAYASNDEKLSKKKFILPKEINVKHLWLLEEGHCMRNQIFNLCELRNSDKESDQFHYEAGSIESLINLVDHYQGITIIPQLAVESLKPAQRKKVREFSKPKPVREIGLVTTKQFARKKLLETIRAEIVSKLPVTSIKNPQVIGIHTSF